MLICFIRFLAVAPRGMDFHKSGQPLTASRASECSLMMAISAGLPRKGIYVFQRNMGNDACALPLYLWDSCLFISTLARYHFRQGSSRNDAHE